MNTNKDIILVDSDLEFEDSLPQQKHGSRPTRRSARQQNAQTKRNRNTSKRVRNSAIVIDEDDSLIIPDDPVFSRSFSNTAKGTTTCSNIAEGTTCSNIAEGTTACSNISLLNPPQTADANPLTENSLTAETQPRRAAKRGLAKRNHELPASDTSIPHRVAVYSQAVAEGFKSLLHGPDPASTDPNIESTQSTATAETNGTTSELSGLTVSSSTAESERMLSRGGQLDLMGEDAEALITSINIQSPSPPPKPVDKRGRRMNKKLTKALKTLNKAKISLNKITPPRRQSYRRDSDVFIVGEEDYQKGIVVKVRYLTKVYRIQMKLTEPFHVLTSKLSQEIDEVEHSLGLFLSDRSLEVTETPQSVNLSVADIIECHLIKVSKETVSAADAIELVIQCRNSKSRITITANRRRPLSDVIQKYAQLVSAEASSFVFSFDGDDIEPTDTPIKLDMEDQDIIDVVYD